MIFSIENFENFMMHLLKIFYKRFHFWVYRLRVSSQMKDWNQILQQLKVHF